MWDRLRYGRRRAEGWVLNNQRGNLIPGCIQTEDLRELVKACLLAHRLPRFPLMQWSEDGHELEVFYPLVPYDPVRRYTLFSAPWAPVGRASQANFRSDLSVVVDKISNRAGHPKKPRGWGRTDPGAPVMVLTEKGPKETFLNRITVKDLTGPRFRVLIEDKQRRYIPYGNPMRWLLQRYSAHVKPAHLRSPRINARETGEDGVAEESSMRTVFDVIGDIERCRHSNPDFSRVSCSTGSAEERGNVVPGLVASPGSLLDANIVAPVARGRESEGRQAAVTQETENTSRASGLLAF